MLILQDKVSHWIRDKAGWK